MTCPQRRCFLQGVFCQEVYMPITVFGAFCSNSGAFCPEGGAFAVIGLQMYLLYLYIG